MRLQSADNDSKERGRPESDRSELLQFRRWQGGAREKREVLPPSPPRGKLADARAGRPKLASATLRLRTSGPPSLRCSQLFHFATLRSTARFAPRSAAPRLVRSVNKHLPDEGHHSQETKDTGLDARKARIRCASSIKNLPFSAAGAAQKKSIFFRLPLPYAYPSRVRPFSSLWLARISLKGLKNALPHSF